MEQKHLKMLGTAVLALFAVFLLVYGYQKLKKALAQLNQKTSVEPQKTTLLKRVEAARSCTKGNLFPLSKGSCGTNVTKLQKLLIKRHGAQIEADGIFGDKTQAEVFKVFNKYSVSEPSLQRYGQIAPSPIGTNGGTTGSTTGQTGGASGSYGDGGPSDYTKDAAPTKALSISAFGTTVKTDLDSVYMLGGRKNTGVWTQMVELSDEDLKAVAQFYMNTFGLSLYDSVNKSRWDITDNVDLLIKNRLITVGYGTGR